MSGSSTGSAPESLPYHSSESIQKMRELMKDVTYCMFTTLDAEGRLRSRPMILEGDEFEGELWFVTGLHTQQAHELVSDARVNISFTRPDHQEFVSVSGRAEFVKDPAKVAGMWRPLYNEWFPGGPTDPDLALLRVTIESAEYWDSPHGAKTQFINLMRVLATGEPPKLFSEHKVVQP